MHYHCPHSTSWPLFPLAEMADVEFCLLCGEVPSIFGEVQRKNKEKFRTFYDSFIQSSYFFVKLEDKRPIRRFLLSLAEGHDTEIVSDGVPRERPSGAPDTNSFKRVLTML